MGKYAQLGRTISTYIVRTEVPKMAARTVAELNEVVKCRNFGKKSTRATGKGAIKNLKISNTQPTHHSKQKRRHWYVVYLVPKFKLINQVTNLNFEILPAFDHSLGSRHLTAFLHFQSNRQTSVLESEDFNNTQPTPAKQMKRTVLICTII